MNRYIHLIIITLIISCNSKAQNDLSNWILKNSETIKHYERNNEHYQVIYSSLELERGVKLNDTSIIRQKFVDSLLLEEIEYNMVTGDSIKWRHKINKYNSDGFLIEEIDSVNGELRNFNIHCYNNYKLQRSEFLTIIPEYNERMERIRIDTIKSTIFNYYDEDDKCYKVMAVKKNNFLTDLTGNVQYDTTLTFNEFDQFRNKVQSLSIRNGDTIAIYRIEYDKMNREIMIFSASLEFGTTIEKFVYDSFGNKIIEQINSDDFRELIKIEYNKQNQQILRETYR